MPTRTDKFGHTLITTAALLHLVFSQFFLTRLSGGTASEADTSWAILGQSCGIWVPICAVITAFHIQTQGQSHHLHPKTHKHFNTHTFAVHAAVTTTLYIAISIPFFSTWLERCNQQTCDPLSSHLLLTTILIQATGEEVLFRGHMILGAQNSQKNVTRAILLSNTLFIAGHAGNIDSLYLSIFFACIASSLTITTGRLEAPLALHLVHNVFSQTVVTYPSSSHWLIPAPETALLSCAIVAVGYFNIHFTKSDSS